MALAAPTSGPGEVRNSWVALVANGCNSTSQTARLFVLDLATGCDPGNRYPGGLGRSDPMASSSPLPVDEDGDRVADYVYAGDLQGICGNSLT